MPLSLSRFDHYRKVKNMKPRRVIGKYSLVNRTIQLWNELPTVALGTLSPINNVFLERG
jgi:hypothetical protein